MRDKVSKTKSFEFAVRIVRLFQHLQRTKQEYILARQLLRCGTAVGAMIRELLKLLTSTIKTAKAHANTTH